MFKLTPELQKKVDGYKELIQCINDKAPRTAEGKLSPQAQKLKDTLDDFIYKVER